MLPRRVTLSHQPLLRMRKSQRPFPKWRRSSDTDSVCLKSSHWRCPAIKLVISSYLEVHTGVNIASADGRVRFFAPRLFEASLCLLGAIQDDGWFFVDVEFLFTVGGDSTGMQGMSAAYPSFSLLNFWILEFPRRPQGLFKKHITEEADLRLAFYLPVHAPPPIIEAPPRPQLPEGLVDAPLVRVFNYLRMFLSIGSEQFTE